MAGETDEVFPVGAFLGEDKGVSKSRRSTRQPAAPRSGVRLYGWKSRSESLAGRTLLAVARQRRELDRVRCELVLQQLDAAAALQGVLQRTLAEFALSELQFGVLVVLFTLDPAPATPADLAAYTQVSRSAMTDAVDRLQELGYVARTRAEADRRMQQVTLTEAGRRIADPAMVAFLRAAGQAARFVEPGEQPQLLSVCRRLRAGAAASSVSPLT